MDEKKGGVKVQTKGSHRDSLSVIKFVETQKEQQSHSQGRLEEQKGSFRKAFFFFFFCVSVISSAAQGSEVPVSSSRFSCNERCSCLGPEAEPAFCFKLGFCCREGLKSSGKSFYFLNYCLICNFIQWSNSTERCFFSSLY